MKTASQVRVRAWQDNRPGASRQDEIAAEVPLALTYNRLSHVVMMGTPSDLEDFGLGFSLTEGIIGSPADLLATAVVPRDGGLEIAMSIRPEWFDRLQTQRRNLTGRTGCGLCGAERIDQALRFPPAVSSRVSVSHSAIQRALSNLDANQPLQALTGATHGAAWCDLDGKILVLREDVGRHNALDKLIGHLAREKVDFSSGFVLVTSRASYEMVLKSAVVGMEVLVAVSAPTALAVEFAQKTALTLVGFARPGRHNVYTFSERITDPD